MHASSSPPQPSADGPDAPATTSLPPAAEILARLRRIGRARPAAAPVLTPFGRYCASVLAATAIEAAVLAEHAALKAS